MHYSRDRNGGPAVQVEFSEQQFDDLRRRIAATRWPSKELVADRS
jgi:hypothetical protein